MRSLTSVQHPDGVLVLTLPHSREPIRVVIDAKYRLARNRLGPRPSDVNAMHRYRDALLLTEMDLGQRPPLYGVVKSWFVYPGDPTGLPESVCLPIRPSADIRERLWQS